MEESELMSLDSDFATGGGIGCKQDSCVCLKNGKISHELCDMTKKRFEIR